jgi:hypothetical protein
MCYQNSVLDRALVSVEGGGLEAPDTDLESVEDHIGRFSDRDLKDAVVAAQQLIDRSHVELSLLVRELDQRHLPELEEHLSTVGWLNRHTTMTPAQASGTLKTGRTIQHMPTVATNALRGVVPWHTVRVLSQARNRHKPEFALQEGVFGDIATYLSVRDLKRAVGYWEQQINYDEALTNVEHHDRLRSLYLAEMLDGMGDIKGTLTPELLHTIKTAVDAKVNPTFLDPDDGRTPAQRRADALGDICSFYLTNATNVVTSGGERPHVTVTVDYDMLKGQVDRLPEINGAPVTPSTIRRITCDAAIIPMILGSQSEPLDVGRKTRTIPTGLRRALEQRDKGCTWQGCGAPVSWCDAHHIIHWANGGHTSLKNTTLLCRTHHTTTHKNEHAAPHY